MIDVSALSISRLITEKIAPLKLNKEKGLILIKDTPEDIGKKIYCSIYVFRMKSCQPVSAFLDSGSDISLIQLPYLKDLLPSTEIEQGMINKINYELTSFSNTQIEIKFSLRLNVSFGKFDSGLEFVFHVINEIPGAPKMLLGADFMKTTMMSLSYVGAVRNPIPEIMALKPVKTRVKSYYVTEKELFSCMANVKLGPYEKRAIEFELNPATQVLPNHSVLISGGDPGKGLYITSSRCQVIYSPEDRTYHAFAFVHNVSPLDVEEVLVGNYEVLSKERVIPVVSKNRHKLAAYALVQDVDYYPHCSSRRKIELLDKIQATGEDCTFVPSETYRLTNETVEKIDDLNDPSYFSEQKTKRMEEFKEISFKDRTDIQAPKFADKGGHPNEIALVRENQKSDKYKRTAKDLAVDFE